MDDTDLEALRNLPVPDPDPAARERALTASLHAFEQARKKDRAAAQGSAARGRLISIFLEPAWRWIMERRVIAGTVAASLLIVPVTAHLLWTDQQGQLRRQFASAPPVEIPKQADKPRDIARLETERKSTITTPQPRRIEEARRLAVRKKEADRLTGAPVATALQRKPSGVGGQFIPSSEAMRNSRQGYRGKGNRSAGARPIHRFADRKSDLRPTVRPETNRDRFESFDANPVKTVAQHPVSTFSIDVDTASYAFVRRSLQRGALPRRDAVRVEEMINYFSYDYARPDGPETPFKASVALYPTPWNADTRLLHIGIKGDEIVPAEKPRSNLVFLVDVSGSMSSSDKLPLLKTALGLLVDRLEPEDSVAVVTYAGRAGTVLEPTKVRDKRKILAALEQLRSGGSTAGAEGIRQAYALAESAFDAEGVNRVILATDGDFNVGISDVGQLKRYIEDKRKSGIFLSVLGFGQGNYNDALMQALAQNGNGNAAYIDTLKEAQKVLVDEARSTLFPIAKDVKIQIEFNPALVSEYRLIGYETRKLRRQDFNDDKIDAGDIGSGHTVTAIYEITPAGAARKRIDDLRYARPGTPEATPAAPANADEYAFLKLRYKLPSESVSKLVTVPVDEGVTRDGIAEIGADMRFAASVAAFGQKLRGDEALGDFGYDEILALAAGARGTDAFGYRSEFLSLVRLAKSLSR